MKEEHDARMDTMGDSTDSRTAASAPLVSTVLSNAADLCARGWVRLCGARDDHGARVEVLADDATHFCALGAIARAAGVASVIDASEHGAAKLLSSIISRGNAETVITFWNDSPSTTQEQVVARLREAAALAESEGR